MVYTINKFFKGWETIPITSCWSVITFNEWSIFPVFILKQHNTLSVPSAYTQFLFYETHIQQKLTSFFSF